MNSGNAFTLRLGVALAVLALAACATPQEAKESANHTAILVTQLETQLGRFRREQELSAQQRLLALRDHEALMQKVMADQNSDARIREAIGATEYQVFARRLQTLADGAQSDDEKLQAALKELNAQIEGLFKPLPDTSRSSAETAKALGAMANELPMSTRIAEFRAAVDAVRKTVDDLNKKAESPLKLPDPSASAASAP